MQISEEIRSAWQIITRNKVRSFLTMLGITIGVTAVIIVMSVGAGAQSLILNQVTSMGSNLIGVLPGQSEEKGPPASVFGIVITTLKNEDGKKVMARGYEHLVAYSGYVRGVDTVTWGENKTDTQFVGVGAELPDVEDTKVESGRFFSDDEDRSLARVAVLGSEVADELFEDQNPLGKRVKIKKTNFTVIGVMRKRGVSGFQNQDNQIFVPITTAQKLLLGIDHVNFMRFKVDSGENVDDSMEFIREILREQHDISKPVDDDFTVQSMAQGLEVLSTITNALRIFLVAVAGISLAVGGIGIMNIMLAAVQERTREIGLRKALGAKNKHIVEQFLVETMMITFIAGIFGVIIGSLIAYIVANIARSMGYDWDLVITASSIIIGCVVSVGIGLLFGIIPARRASRLDPIEALRYE
ncbi:ABC transporter permease [Patescibacteria group bacterium]|nr:ABC transporter permease [Patescibacteria group bacterium]